MTLINELKSILQDIDNLDKKITKISQEHFCGFNNIDEFENLQLGLDILTNTIKVIEKESLKKSSPQDEFKKIVGGDSLQDLMFFLLKKYDSLKVWVITNNGKTMIKIQVPQVFENILWEPSVDTFDKLHSVWQDNIMKFLKGGLSD